MIAQGTCTALAFCPSINPLNETISITQQSTDRLKYGTNDVLNLKILN
jgi:hypothetical protein